MTIEVIVKDNNIEQALRVFKRKVLKSGLLRKYRAKQVYEKPSDKRQRKKKEGIANAKRQKRLREKFG
jgi:small subunit ribosomal protein S21|tara:strand:+ start:1563 stop:1766 length:204 start_codon:yes stop_codon:yes gene_type:complete